MYIYYSPPQNSAVRGQFQEFLSLTGHQLEQRPFPDVVQLALAQPQGSEVHRQALLQARAAASRGSLYFDWQYVTHPLTESRTETGVFPVLEQGKGGRPKRVYGMQ